MLIILLGILHPIFLSNTEENWEENLNLQIDLIENHISSEIGMDQKLILNTLEEYKDSIRGTLRSNVEFLEFPEQINTNYLFFLADSSNNLIAWNYSTVITQSSIYDTYFKPGETYFFSSNLIDYLTVYDTIHTESNLYYLAVFKPVQKKYKIENKYFLNLSWADELSLKFSTEFELYLFKEAQATRDGRKYSFPILNTNNNKIGVVTFVKPLREVALQKVNQFFSMGQSILLVVLISILGLLVLKYLNNIKFRFLKLILITVYISVLRFAIYSVDITSLISSWEISNSKYFSSLFAFGIAGSPFELFLSLAALSFIVFCAFNYALEYYRQKNGSDEITLAKFLIQLVLFSAVYLISLRGLGASAKSIVLDSSIRYYKESSLFPSFIETVMLFNVLIIGLIFFVGGIVYLLIIFANRPNKFDKTNFFFSVFVLLQLSAVIYDLIQKEPQGSPIFRVLFILFSFFAVYFITRNNKAGIKEFFVYSIVSSVMVILLLTQYNSLVEKESIRKTAYNLTRQNEDLLKFAVQETLVKGITDRETVQSFYSDNSNSSSIAFKLWSNSILQKESLGSSVVLLNADNDQIGSFNFRFNHEFEINWDLYSDDLSDLHEIKIFEEDIIYSDNKIIRGIASVEDVEGVLGYITVSVIYDISSLGLLEAPDFMISDVGFINDAIDFSKLKIFDFHQGTLINTISNYNLNENEILEILGASFNEYGEAWLNLNLNNENHLVFVLKREQDGISRVLSVALKEKELSWGLFDFFKLFFTHLIIILIAFIIYLSFLLTKYRRIKFSFATKLLLSFILISLVPLILVSFFFRTVTSDKNDAAIEYKLGKRAISVEQYFDNYLYSSNLNLNTIAQKATIDLGIDYTLFRMKDFQYSSNSQYYEAGLIPKILNPVAYDKLYINGLNETLIKESIEKYYFNALYYKTSLLGEYHIIKITDGFNKIMLPLSGQEVDVYIFVSYSVAILIILILGFILTNQISRPIERLKNATKSIAGGDLSIEVSKSSNDEVGELVDGFNFMVKELKRSQAELAEFERETAWKEMAKQVAHEIKNPLTPMKLSVQQLKAAFDDKSPKFEQLFDKVTKTIITQIETLKNIASEFSSFARMPNPKLEIVNLPEILNDAADLFSDEKILIVIDSDSHSVEADKDQIKRVFINLIRNSVQASATKVEVTVTSIENFVIIDFSDNGSGIRADDIEKIFELNFSTKSSGMGIGLSMAKKTIENIGGRISLKKTDVTGTIFEIKFPLV